MLLKAVLAYHQLSHNIDRSTIFLFSPLPLHSSHPSAVPAVTSLEIVIACCYSVGQWRLDTNSVLSHATEIPTNNKYRNLSRRAPEQVVCTFLELNVYFSSWQHLEACKLFTCILEIAI